MARTGAWHEGSRAWDRLRGWLGDGVREGAHPDTGAAALAALTDVGSLRRLLDQAELAAVRTARGHGRSWAEIATGLGVSRQSAWERWRDLDDVPAEPGPAADPLSEQISAEAAGRRRRGLVRVPDVVGYPFTEARSRVLAAGLVIAGPDPDGVPLTAEGWPRGRVRRQAPEGGARVDRGSTVTVWLSGGGGGGSGDREPRRPDPPPREGRALPEEWPDPLTQGLLDDPAS